jgi:tRNA modification GTPase
MARTLPTTSERDTITACATGPGPGAIAIVRLSGPAAHAIADRVFTPDAEGRTPEPARLLAGRLHRAGDAAAVVDACLAVRWVAPHSYTGENVVEFHLHGSPAVVDATIAACLAAGARLARPGEFTRRAFENGRLDLAQAQAVCDLIGARTEAAGRVALAQLSGGLSKRLARVRDAIVPLVAELEAHVDFPEEGLELSTRERLGGQLDAAIMSLEELLEGAGRGLALREGARVVLAGRPNAGKSSLFNALVGRERALVTPHPGTTRDTVEAEVELHGVPLTLVDTAGLRDTAEEIEALGIQRSRGEMRSADLILFLAESTDEPATVRAEYAAVAALPHVLAVTKCELAGDERCARLAGLLAGDGRVGVVVLSVAERRGLDTLERAVLGHLQGRPSAEAETPLVSHRRHVTALRHAMNYLATAAEGLQSGFSPEFIVVDLTAAIAQIDDLTGRNTLDEDVLDQIFSRFCLGK